MTRMKLTDLKVDRIRTPLGFYTDRPVFSWAVEDTAAGPKLVKKD
mgnify:CR=1 FL=1